MDYFASIGIRRVYWQFYEPELLRRPLTTGDDPLALACRLARERGMECYALIKPWETGIAYYALPDHWPATTAFTGVNGLMGLYPWCTDFVRRHPQMRLEHRNANLPPDVRPVTRIKLISGDDRPTAVTVADIEIYTSPHNGDFAALPRNWTLRQAIEFRENRQVRVLIIEGIRIPAERKYLLIVSSRHGETVTFGNRVDRLLELDGPDGKPIRFTWDDAVIPSFDMRDRFRVVNLLCKGEQSAPTIPPGYGTSLSSSSFMFDLGHFLHERGLDGTQTPMLEEGGGWAKAAGAINGHIAAARGYNTHVIGGLHPCYPETREYWLGWVRQAVACGVDGVDLRFANHSTWSGAGLEYGFNQPVADEFHRRHGTDIRTEPFDLEVWKALNTEHLTTFLRAARELLRTSGKALQLHVNGAFELERTQHPSCIGGRNNVPVCFAYPWEKWLAEGLADAVTLKDIRAPMVSPAAGEVFARRVCQACADRAIPVYVDSWICATNGHAYWDECTEFIRRWLEVPGVAGCILYEGNTMVRYDKPSGAVNGSEAIGRFLGEFRRKRGRQDVRNTGKGSAELL